MILMIDTNVVLDIVLKREPFFEDSYLTMLNAGENADLTLLSASAMTDLFYVLRKSIGAAAAKEAVENLQSLIDYADVTRSDIEDAFRSSLPDLEDVKITKVPGFKVIFNGEQRTDVYLKYNQYWEDLTVFVPIDRMPNTMTAQGKTVKIKASKLKKKKQIIKPAKSLRICNAVGSLKFKLAGVNKKKFKKYFKVNAKNGNITIKKGLKKGKYKLKTDITAAGNANYLAGTKQVTVTVRVK